MKTIFTFAMTLGFCFSLMASSVNDTLGTLSGVSYRYQKVKVTLLEGAGKVKISILDDRGIKVHSELITVSDNVVYPLDLSQMPAGKYTVRITNKVEKIEHGIEVKPKF